MTMAMPMPLRLYGCAHGLGWPLHRPVCYSGSADAPPSSVRACPPWRPILIHPLWDCELGRASSITSFEAPQVGQRADAQGKEVPPQLTLMPRTFH
jgi:hypothetical protein